jgi:hypothetical protein
MANVLGRRPLGYGRIALVAMALASSGLASVWAQASRPKPAPPPDAIARAAESCPAAVKRPEQAKSAHDLSDIFDVHQAEPSSPVFLGQPKQGKVSGFDFYRDPLNADKPYEDPFAIQRREIANKPNIVRAQQKLLEERYDLTPKLDPIVNMSRGKPLCVGPTARLKSGLTWDKLAAMRPEDIKQLGVFPYPSLPHPLQANGGQVFPKMQIEMFPRLERVDVDFGALGHAASNTPTSPPSPPCRGRRSASRRWSRPPR